MLDRFSSLPHPLGMLVEPALHRFENVLERVAAVHWLEELGLAQAVWVLDVENFGPFLVESDLDGHSLFERENAKVAPGLERLYQGTRPATLRRYGETDDKTEEVI